MLSSEIQSGRMYGWVYEGEGKFLKGGRMGKPANPFNDLTVTVRKVYTGQAATGERWVREANALAASAGTTYAPSDRAPQHLPTENPCIVKSVSTGELQVRIMSFRKTKEEIFIAGKLATPAQLAILGEYKPAPRAGNPLMPKVMFPYLHNLVNVEDNLAVMAASTSQTVNA